MKILCPRCKLGRIDRDRCSLCGYEVSSSEEQQEKIGRLARNSLIGLVSVLAAICLFRLV